MTLKDCIIIAICSLPLLMIGIAVVRYVGFFLGVWQ